MSMETSKRRGGGGEEEEEEECQRMIKMLEEVSEECRRMIKKLKGKAAAADENNGGGGIVVSSSEKLMEEILLWLPPASVARFKSVSSNWMQRLSKPSFTEQHEVRNLSLLGFYYNKSYAHVQFAHVGNSFTSTTTGCIEPNEFYSARRCQPEADGVLAVVSSSNGLLLLYCSSFGKQNPYFLVQNPFARKKLRVLGPLPNVASHICRIRRINKRFLVYGFAFEPHSTIPDFTVVELTDAILPNGFGLLVNKYSRNAMRWESKVHIDDVVPVLGNKFVLSGPSTFHNGALHWLLEPSGVIAYDIHIKRFSCSLINIPGDKCYVDGDGLCNCTRKTINRPRGDTQFVCTCRYLGESRGRLIYVRVTGDSEFSVWSLDDYYHGIWSHSHSIIVDNLQAGASLFYGRVLAFDRRYAHVVFFRLTRMIYSYNCITRELKEVCKIEKLYDGEERNCFGFIFPYELHRRIPPSIPKKFPLTSNPPPSNPQGTYIEDQSTNLRIVLSLGTSETNTMAKNPCYALTYYHNGVTKVAAKFLPHLQSRDTNAVGFAVGFDGVNPAELPFRSPFDIYAPACRASVVDATILYNDLVRVEASLYGGVGGRLHQNI